MAQVPTVSAPTQGISGAPLGISAPAEAFGANVLGDAASRTGAVLSHGSDLLEQHAQAQQDLNNKAASDVSYSAFANKANDIQSEFHNLHGADAINAWPKFQQDLEMARANLGQGLNPVASSYYNQETRRIQAGMLSTARGYADTQQQQYVKDSSALKVQSFWQTYSASPTEENLINAIGGSKEEYGFQVRLELGNSAAADQVSSLVTEKVSADFSKTLKGLSGDDPIAAWHLAQAHSDLLYGADKQVIGQLKRAAVPQMAAIDADTVAKPIAAGTAPQRGSGEYSSLTPQDVISNLKADPAGFIQSISGVAVKVTSAQRTPEQNAAANGSPTSEHLSGTAWDLVPTGGQTMVQLGQAIHDSGIPYDQLEVTPTHVHVGLRQGALRQEVIGPLAGQIGGNAPGVPPNSIQFRAGMQASLDQVPALAKQRFPDDADAGSRAQYEQTLTQAIISRTGHTYEAMQASERESAASVLGTVIQSNLQDESQLSSQQRGVIAGLPPSTQLAVRSAMNSNANQLTDVRQVNETVLTGRLAQAQTNPQAVLNTDVSQFDTTRAFRMQFLKAQANLKGHIQASQESDHTVNRALASSSFGATMRQLSITAGTPEYDHLVGGLKAEVQNFAETHQGKMPSDKELAPLMAQAAATQFQTYNNFFLGMKTGTSVEPISDEDKAKAVSTLKALGNTNPNEQDVGNMVEQLYIHQRGRAHAAR